MTIHCVVSFFEKGDCGYLLGSDSSIGRLAKGEVVENFLFEKAFFSENSIGLLGGNFCITPKPTLEEAVFSQIKSLDGVFEDIDEFKDYSRVSLLEQAMKYRLFIAKKNEDNLKLYRISSIGKDQNKAKIIHSFDKDSYESSKVWYSVLSHSYFLINYKERFTLEEAIKITNSALNPGIENYDPGPSHLYVVSFNRIERLPIS